MSSLSCAMEVQDGMAAYWTQTERHKTVHILGGEPKLAFVKTRNLYSRPYGTCTL